MPQGDQRESEGRIDARPQMVADSRSIWAEAVRERDRIADGMTKALDGMNLDALVYCSPPGEYPVVVALVAWELQDEGDAFERMTREHVRITIDVLPYRLRPLRYTVETRNARRLVKRSFRDGDRIDVDDLVDYALSRGRFPRGLRFNFDEFGRNWLERLWPRIGIVEEARGDLITVPKALTIAALVLALLPFAAPLPQLVAILLLIPAIFIALRRPRLHGVLRRPPISPRSLSQVDFWHVNLPDAASDSATVRSRIEAALDKLDQNIERRWESHRTAMPYGYERHEWLVLTKGQAMVYVVIHTTGSDLLIGWEGYLNFACWAETVPAFVCVQRGERVELRGLTAASYTPGWADLSDLTALMQGVHQRITEVVRVVIAERDINAEIDFDVVRGDRATVLAGKASRQSAGQLQQVRGSGGWRDVLKRN